MKQKIIFFTKVKPALDGTGVQLRCARHIVSLAKIFDVILIHSTSNDDEIGEVASYCHRIKKVNTQKSKDVPKGLFSSSFDVHYGEPTTSEIEEVKKTIIQFSPQRIFLFRLTTAKLLNHKVLTELIPAKYWLLDLDDIESRATFRYAIARHKEIGKLTAFKVLLDALKLRNLENAIFKNVGKVLVCSIDDKRILEKRIKNNVYHVVPNVINRVDPLALSEEQVDILFVGTMNYMPNEQAAIYFCRKVLPLIVMQLKKEVNVKIVGFNPRKEALELSSGNVEVTGGVASVRPYYEKARVVVAPILSGGGTRIKILEAMSYQRAVVSSTIGAEGLGVNDGVNILLADNANAFADAVVKLIKSDQYNIDIATNGLAMVTENFTQKTLDCIYKDMF